MKRILTRDGNKTETFHYDAHDDGMYISSETNVDELVKANKFQRDTAPMRHTEEIFNKKASIDCNAILAWCRPRGISYGEFLGDPEILKTFLNDPDNEVWLTRKGKV